MLLRLPDSVPQADQLLLRLADLPVQPLLLLRKGTHLRRTAQGTAPLGGRTAGKGTAHVDLLSVQRDHADAVPQRLRHGCGMIDGVEHQRAPQQRGQHRPEAVITGQQRIRHGDIAGVTSRLRHLRRRTLPAHGGEREEGSPAGVLAFERVHRRLGGRLVLHHNVLEIGAQRRFHRRDIGFFHLDKL